MMLSVTFISEFLEGGLLHQQNHLMPHLLPLLLNVQKEVFEGIYCLSSIYLVILQTFQELSYNLKITTKHTNVYTNTHTHFRQKFLSDV